MSENPDPMEALRGRFLARLAAERQALAESAEHGDRVTLRAICHRIAGAGGMFGFPELSRLASEIEERIEAGVSVGEIAPSIAQLLAEIKLTLAA